MSDISKIDKNFAIKKSVAEPDIEWFNVLEEPFSVHGVIYDEIEQSFLRFPKKDAERVSEGVAVLNTNTSGGRVRFKTNSSYIAISTIREPSGIMAHMPRTGQSGFDLYRMVDGKEIYFSTFIPPIGRDDNFSSGTKTTGELTDYTINFPLYDGVKEFYIGLKKDAILLKPEPYKHSIPIVYYGNSITQGGCASRPGNSYPGFISRRLSADFVNLGFSGSGKGEPEMAKYIAGMNMSVLVIDYDSNAPTEEHLQETHYNFYKIIRDKNPDLPIILISHPSALHKIYFKMNASENWGTFEKRKEIIKRTYDCAIKEGDNNIYFIDGSEIFKGEEWDSVTVDGTHPNDFGFLRFAQYLEKLLIKLL